MIILKKFRKGKRIDRTIMKTFPSATLSEIYKWLRIGKIKINGKKCSGDYKLKEEDEIKIFLSDEQILDYKQKGVVHKTSFEILFEDEYFLIVNKPPFLASQGGIGVKENNLVNQVRFYLKGTETTVALANRLDIGTSGIIIFGKSEKANSKLYQLTKKRAIEKTYYALTIEKPKPVKGTIDCYIKKSTKDYVPIMKVCKKADSNSKHAITDYKTLESRENYALLELILKTGRMHQIRLQFSSKNAPVLGDKTYGNEKINKKWSKLLKRQFLHAAKIKFVHPFTKKKLEISAPFSKDLKKVLKKLKFDHTF